MRRNIRELKLILKEMKKFKILDLFVMFLFSYFAFVQINDSDGTKWMIIYGMIALIGFLSFIDRLNKTYVTFIFSFLLGFTIFNISLLTSWLEAGQPAFIDYEPTDITEVENIREFLGLCLSLIFCSIYLFRKKKHPKAN